MLRSINKNELKELLSALELFPTEENQFKISYQTKEGYQVEIAPKLRAFILKTISGKTIVCTGIDWHKTITNPKGTVYESWFEQHSVLLPSERIRYMVDAAKDKTMFLEKATA